MQTPATLLHTEDNYTTHVDEVGVEPLAQVLEEGVHILVVLQQYEVLHAYAVPGMQGALHLSTHKQSRSKQAVFS